MGTHIPKNAVFERKQLYTSQGVYPPLVGIGKSGSRKVPSHETVTAYSVRTLKARSVGKGVAPLNLLRDRREWLYGSILGQCTYVKP